MYHANNIISELNTAQRAIEASNKYPLYGIFEKRYSFAIVYLFFGYKLVTYVEKILLIDYIALKLIRIHPDCLWLTAFEKHYLLFFQWGC